MSISDSRKTWLIYHGKDLLKASLLALVVFYSYSLFYAKSVVLVAPSDYGVLYAEFTQDEPVLVHSVYGDPVVICHGYKDEDRLYVHHKSVSPHYLIKILVEDKGVKAGEDVLIICCYPGDKKPGEYMGVKYHFSGNEKRLIYTWPLFPFLVAEHQFGR
jgi:hypothetical protein